MKRLLVSLSLVGMTSVSLAATQVITLNPFSNGNVQASNKTQGYCWAHSLSTSRPDAWRCMAGNSVYDPCFSNPNNPKQVACIQRPEKNQITLMQLTKPFPKVKPFRYNAATAQPWVVKLDNGTVCNYMTGATSVINKMRLNYGCSKTTYILGNIDRSQATWTANIYDMNTKTTKTASIKQAWF